MTPLLTRLRSMAGANSGHFECCLSIQEVREIVRALEAGPWQPIETARQSDHEPVLLYETGHIGSGRFVASSHRPGWYMCGNSPDVDYPCPDRPTHWMELPEPPAAPPLSSPAEVASFIDSMGTPKMIEGCSNG